MTAGRITHEEKMFKTIDQSRFISLLTTEGEIFFALLNNNISDKSVQKGFAEHWSTWNTQGKSPSSSGRNARKLSPGFSVVWPHKCIWVHTTQAKGDCTGPPVISKTLIFKTRVTPASESLLGQCLLHQLEKGKITGCIKSGAKADKGCTHICTITMYNSPKPGFSSMTLQLPNYQSWAAEQLSRVWKVSLIELVQYDELPAS